LTGVSDTGLTGLNLQGDNSIPSNLEDNKAELQDWRKPIIDYLCDPCQKVDRKVQRFTLKFILVDEKLYRWTIDDLLLECLDSEQANVAMGEVHEGISGTNQSTPKMKWLLIRASFYWPSIIVDCFIVVLHLCLFKLETLLSHIRSNCSIHPHSMLRRTVRPSLVIKRWSSSLSKKWKIILGGRISRHGATKVISFELVYGQEVILHVVVNLAGFKLAKKNDLSIVDYHDIMIDNIDDITNKRLEALKENERDKARVVKAYKLEGVIQDSKSDHWKFLYGSDIARWVPRALNGRYLRNITQTYGITLE
jgi:hypothetical protein